MKWSKPKRKAHGSDPRYNGRPWRRYREAYLRTHPLCVECGGVAQMVDHVKPVRLHPELDFYDPTNHASMCHRCHNAKRGRESHISQNYDRQSE